MEKEEKDSKDYNEWLDKKQKEIYESKRELEKQSYDAIKYMRKTNGKLAKIDEDYGWEIRKRLTSENWDYMIEEMKIKYNCEESYGCPNSRTKKCKNSCLNIVIAILATLFIGVIGVIIGAALSAAILLALPAVIVLAIVLFILLVLSIIVAICCKCKTKKTCCK